MELLNKLLHRTQPVKVVSMECKKCGTANQSDVLESNNMICPNCGAYLRMNARQRINLLIDDGTFKELDAKLTSKNLIGFPDYDEKLKKAQETSGAKEAVTCGTGKVNGLPCAIFVMDAAFMMGSMGSVVGEKITRLFEYATKNRLPVVGVTTSGGARMQEGVISLMQMAKTSGAAKRHSEAGLLYLTIIADPTTGGVTASFAMLGDIIIAEPKALIGFAGRRVVEQTTGKALPDGFQTAEFMLEHGFIDMIEDRSRLKSRVHAILDLHK